MDPGRREAVLATADAEDDEERAVLWHGYVKSGYEDLAEAVDQADRALSAAEKIVIREYHRAKLWTWMYRDGKEL